MKYRAMWGASALGVLAVVSTLAGCGDEPLGGDDVGSGLELPTTDAIADVSVPDASAEVDVGSELTDVEDDAEAETLQPEVNDDATDAGDAAVEAEAVEEVGPEVEVDIAPDTESPTIISTSPSHGEDGVATPFTVEVVFSEKMAVQTIVDQTFWIENVNGNKMPGEITIGDDLASLTWTPEFPDGLVPLSAYRIVIDGNIVTDAAGNDLEGGGLWTASFFTGDYPDTAGYAALARQYAPTIRSASGSDPRAQVPTRVDVDGDFNGFNTAQWLSSADSVVPAVYWAVSETRSHYFIHYMYFFPLLNDPTPGNSHGNGASGAMVVVEKAHGDVEQRPVAVTTYFKSKQYEENRTFVTQESGIKGSSSASFYDLRGVFPQATLFPGDRFESYVTAGTHESCLWIQEQTSTFCNLESFSKPTLKVLEFAPTADGEAATPFEEVEGSFPTEMADVDDLDAYLYELVSVDVALWPRRINTSSTDGLFTSTKPVVADPGRPADGLEIPFKFVDPFDPVSSSFGRPVWAWLHNPASGSVSAGINDGEFGLDPAWYFWKRHKSDSQTTALEAFDETTLDGFSVDYCFNAKAKLDNRATDPFCQ